MVSDSNQAADLLSIAKSLEKEMPLLAALLHLNASERLSYHMPGHRNGRQWPQWLRENITYLDTTELLGSDDLLAPSGPALKSLEMISKTFGSGWSRFLTAGTTSGILSLLATCPGRGGRLMMSKVCHQSVLHAVALLDIEVIYVKPTLFVQNKSDGCDDVLLPQISCADIQAAFKKYGACDAVFITSPDYYGSCAELELIASFVHDKESILLVDEAHGAHLSIDSSHMPVSAMVAGADACVQSVHKTLPALTSAALLHVSAEAIEKNRLDLDRLSSMIKVFHTSSPSFAIAGSIEYSRFYLQSYGSDLIDNLLKNIEYLAKNLPWQLRMVRCLDNKTNNEKSITRDPLRIVLCLTDPRYSAGELSLWLQKKGIDIEMADLCRLVLIPSLDQPREDFEILSFWLRDWFTLSDNKLHYSINSKVNKNLYELDKVWKDYLTEYPSLRESSGEIIFKKSKKKLVSFEQAVNCIAAQAIIPYPPGIPLIWPGEILTKEKLDFISLISENGLNITGITNKSLFVIG